MPTSRRKFLIGATSGLLAACQSSAPAPEAPPPVAADPPPAPPAPPPEPPPPTPEPPPPTVERPVDPPFATLKNFIRKRGSETGALPPAATEVPAVSWAGPFATSADAPPTTLPNGRRVAISDAYISKPVAQLYSASFGGNPVVGGLPCMRPQREFTSRGIPRDTVSVQMLRLKTDAPVIELTGVIAEGSYAATTLIVDGALVRPQRALACDRGGGGGWLPATLRIDFGSRRLRDICVETPLNLAFIKVDQTDYFLPVDDTYDLQMTVAGDSYLQVKSDVFSNGGAIALGLGTRLGIRKIATDAVGGTGYWNSGYSQGTLPERLAAHAADSSDIYVVMAGVNDFGDSTVTGVFYPTRNEYESALFGYFQGLRTARPNAVIVATAPFCPIPRISDIPFTSSPITNDSGMGDNLFKAFLVKEALRRIEPPWVYVDVLMGTGWLNSSGATGDVTNLQWFTGGNPSGGGGFGGIATVPVISPGRYRQAPEIVAVGGSGSGLLLAARLDSTGGITRVVPVVPGHGYTAGELPSLVIDPTFEIEPATLGAPSLLVGINPDGQYPLLASAPPGVTAAELNNIYMLLSVDTTHPSALGAEHIARRLAQNIYAAVLAL